MIDEELHYIAAKEIVNRFPNKLYDIYIGNFGLDECIRMWGTVDGLASFLVDVREYKNQETRSRTFRRYRARIEKDLSEYRSWSEECNND